jgi:hypothetical protein
VWWLTIKIASGVLSLIWVIGIIHEWADRSHPVLSTFYPEENRNLRSVFRDQLEHLKRFKI